MHAAAREFQAQGVAVALQRELAGVVGATILHGHQAKHRAVLHDAPLACRQHGGQYLANEVMPAKEVGLELLAQRLGGQIFQRTGLAIVSKLDVVVDWPPM